MTTELTTTQKLNVMMDDSKVSQMFQNALGDNSNQFVASMIELVSNDNKLQECQPREIMLECLKAAVLKLPVNKSLGFSWIIPYNQSFKVGNKWEKRLVPQFQLGKNGVVQLALRTGKYKTIHSGTLYDGQTVEQNFLTGEVKITGAPTSDKEIGYFAHFELTNGFTKSLFWTKKRVEAHAKKYSKSYGNKKSPWSTEFNEMAKGTMLKRLIQKYGIMSTEMATSFTGETAPQSVDSQLANDVSEQANSAEIIDIPRAEPQQNATEQDGPDY